MQFRSFLLGHTHTSNGSFWPILLKKSVSEKAAFRQLENRSISALLRKIQSSSVFLAN